MNRTAILVAAMVALAGCRDANEAEFLGTWHNRDAKGETVLTLNTDGTYVISAASANTGRTNRVIMTGAYVVRQDPREAGQRQLVLQPSPAPTQSADRGGRKKDAPRDVDVVKFQIKRGALVLQSRPGQPPVRYERGR